MVSIYRIFFKKNTHVLKTSMIILFGAFVLKAKGKIAERRT